MDTAEERLTLIETKLAFLEDFMNKLQAITVDHTDELDRLKNENRAIRAKMGEIEDAVQDIPNRRPPHY